MIRKSNIYFIVIFTMFLVNSCKATPTPAAIPLSAKLKLYTDNGSCKELPSKPGAEITYESWMQGGFSGTLALTGLNPDHEYSFTINGKEGSEATSKLLKSSCTDSASYNLGFCDYTITSNSQGEASVTIQLGKGLYDTKFFIKDNDGDPKSCVLLYQNNPPKFEIK